MPIGKVAKDENFPVASVLLERNVRRHVAIFYRFARAADDIADDPRLTPAEKIELLDSIASIIEGCEQSGKDHIEACRMRDSLSETSITPNHCLNLLLAFKLDAIKHRYANWSELIEYCQFSANPVGRYLLDIHGESSEGHRSSDALCTALQLINHMQDAQSDYLALDRVYLPMDWFAEFGLTVSDLAKSRTCPNMRAIVNRYLDGVSELLEIARPLPLTLVNGRLAAETGAVLALALKLERRLRKRDPFAYRVELSRIGLVATSIWGASASVLRRNFGGTRIALTRERSFDAID